MARQAIPGVSPVPADATRVLCGTRVEISDDARKPAVLKTLAGRCTVTPVVAARVQELLDAAHAYRRFSQAMMRRDEALVAAALELGASVQRSSARAADLESTLKQAKSELARANEEPRRKRAADLESRLQQAEFELGRVAEELREERAVRRRLEQWYEHDVRRKFEVVTCPEVFKPTAPRKYANADPAGKADLQRCVIYERATRDWIKAGLMSEKPLAGDTPNKNPPDASHG